MSKNTQAAITTHDRGTNIGPLLTTFTPPAACSSSYMWCSTCGVAWAGQECKDGPADRADCWPPAATTVTTKSAPLLGWGYYSPGTVCPSGYTTACTNISPPPGGNSGSSISLATPTTFQWALNAGETAVGCCPRGYTCAVLLSDGVAQTCQSVASSTTFPATICDHSRIETPTIITLPISTGTDSAVQIMTFRAPLFQINWQASDRPAGFQFTDHAEAAITSQASSISASTTAFTASTTASTTSSTASTTPSTSASPRSGLSTGAKIGIGVTVPVLVLLFLSMMLFVWRTMRRRKPSALDSQYSVEHLQPQELPVLVENGGGMRELPVLVENGGGLRELQGEKEPGELAASGIHELESRSPMEADKERDSAARGVHELGPASPRVP